MPKPTMEGHAIMKCPLVVHGFYALSSNYFNDLLFWKVRGCIGSYARLQMVSILGLVSLYGVLILHRDILAHVGCVSRAMGLHNGRNHSMDPYRGSEIVRDPPFG